MPFSLSHVTSSGQSSADLQPTSAASLRPEAGQCVGGFSPWQSWPIAGDVGLKRFGRTYNLLQPTMASVSTLKPSIPPSSSPLVLSLSSSSAGAAGVDDAAAALLCSLAESGSFSSALRLVFDRQYQAQYPAVLQQSIAAKDARIRLICHQHYLSFLSSVDSLMAVQGDMGELRSSVRQLNSAVQQSAAQLIKAASAVSELRRQRHRLNEAREVCRQGQYLIQLADKATQQISKRKYFSALKVTSALHARQHAFERAYVALSAPSRCVDSLLLASVSAPSDAGPAAAGAPASLRGLRLRSPAGYTTTQQRVSDALSALSHAMRSPQL